MKQKAIMYTKRQQHTQYAQNLYQGVAIKSLKYTFKNTPSKKLQGLLVIPNAIAITVRGTKYHTIQNNILHLNNLPMQAIKN